MGIIEGLMRMKDQLAKRGEYETTAECNARLDRARKTPIRG